MRKTRPRQATNTVRIIGGAHRGRRLSFPDIDGLRPSTDRVRETVFNWLQPYLPGARVLDLFAGSGVLGFEALSRGAAHVSFVDTEREVCKQIQENISLLNLKNTDMSCAGANAFLESYCGPSLNIVFVDPPFNKEFMQKTCDALFHRNVLASNARIYVEAEFSLENIVLPESWCLVRHKKAGAVYYGLISAAGE